MLDRWDLIAYSFARHLRIDLYEVMGTRPWAWFVRLLSGLLSDESTMICRYFHQQTEPGEG